MSESVSMPQKQSVRSVCHLPAGPHGSAQRIEEAIESNSMQQKKAGQGSEDVAWRLLHMDLHITAYTSCQKKSSELLCGDEQHAM